MYTQRSRLLKAPHVIQRGCTLSLLLSAHAPGRGLWRWGRSPVWLVHCEWAHCSSSSQVQLFNFLLLLSTALLTQIISGSCMLFILPSLAFQPDLQAPRLQQQKEKPWCFGQSLFWTELTKKPRELTVNFQHHREKGRRNYFKALSYYRLGLTCKNVLQRKKNGIKE